MGKVLKRILDIILSVVLIIVALPLLVVVSLIIVIDDGFPVLFVQKRVGYRRKTFPIIKFRTMRVDAPQAATRELINPDRYITRFGRFLRRTSIDELPQLFNILSGKMSLVGPRPVVENETQLIALRERYGIYSLKPGVTGWAQINGRDLVSVEDKVRMDRYYLENQSLLLDLKIILRTIHVVLFQHGIHEGCFEADERR